MKSLPPQHRSYLLRLWRSGEGKTWRAMLEEVSSHETYHFADTEELCAFLRKQVEADGGPPPSDVATG
ncbi:MAG: hypothetical protein H5T61_13040 [Thermoflexales bacterium]|nr:hypothetical protein [Thermoflexales bacterium]